MGFRLWVSGPEPEPAAARARPQDSGPASRSLLRRSGILKDGGRSHPCPDAHGHDAVRPAFRKTEVSDPAEPRVPPPPPPPDSPAQPLSSPPELVEQRHHLAGSCAAQRVSQGDGAAVRVDLVQRDSQLLHAVHSLGGGGGQGQSPELTQQEAARRSPDWRRPR